MGHKAKKKQSAPVLEMGLERWRDVLDESEFTRLEAEVERTLLPAFRFNPLKVAPERALEEWSARYGWKTHPVPYCPLGRWVEEGDTPVSAPIEHRLGQYYIQDAASMLPVELFDIQPDPQALALDLAASPGGKTTHLISRMGDQGLVLANDSSADRVTALRLVLQGWGAANTMVSNYPGERFGTWFPETFDRVLLDAPCSMQGLRTSESHPVRPVTEKEVQQLSRRQAGLLESALRAVKVGGQVVYSTCTLTPDEDEGVLDELLGRFPGALRVEDLTRRLPVPAPGIPSDGERSFDPAVRGAARLWPHIYGTAGFFAALLTKTAEIPGKEADHPSRSLEKSGLTHLPRREAAVLLDQLRQAYGFDFSPVMEKQGLSLWRHGVSLYALPDLWLRLFADLPFSAVGMLVGEENSGGEFAPSHEWVARFGTQFTAGRLVVDEGLLPAWLRGEDLPGGEDCPSGVAAVFDTAGRLLGRGKPQRGKIKNLLPRRFVY